MLFFRLNKKNNSEDSDEYLLLRFKETGDIKYFEQLYTRYIPLIYGVCLKYLKQPALSQDAVIDLYENLSTKITSYEILIFKNWLHSVVRNHCFQILKTNNKEYLVNFDSDIMESDVVLNLFKEDLDDDKEDALRKCIELLPHPQRLALEKFFYEDKSYVDITDETGFNIKSVKSYIQNGKRNLKNCIEKNLKE